MRTRASDGLQAQALKAVAYKKDGPGTVWACPPGRVELCLLTKGQQEAVEHAEHPGVPALVLQVQKAVDGIAAQQGKEDPGQVPERHLWGGVGWVTEQISSAGPVQWLYSSFSSTHTWSSRLGQGNFQVALGTLDLARK